MDDKSVKRCPSCGTLNAPEFSYCKNCGTALPESAAQEAPAGNASASGDFTVCGAKSSVTAAFIGKNAGKFIYKFANMDTGGSQNSWNWPVFLFGLFLGMPFIWFLYRKMYKIGFILLAAGAAISVAAMICVIKTVDITMEAMAQYLAQSGMDMSSFVGMKASDLYRFSFAVGKSISGSVLILSAVNILLQLISLAITIVFSIRADDIYRRHCERKLRELRSGGEIDPAALQKFGGTNVAAPVSIGICLPLLIFITYMTVFFTATMNFYSGLF